MDLGLLLTVIWPYLAVLYILDCILIVRGGQFLLTGNGAPGFKVRGPGLRPAGMLPWDWSVLVTREPMILTGTGIYARTDRNPDPFRPPGPDDFHVIPWEQVVSARRDGKKLIVNGRLILSASTGIEALAGCRKILRVLDLPPAQRPGAVREIAAAAGNMELIQRTMDDVKRSARPLIIVSAALFFWTLALVPVSLLLRLPPPVLWMEVFLFLAGWLTIVILWWRAHRALFPEASGDRLEETFVFLFFPVSVLHAFGKLTRRALADFDSTALIAVLAPSLAPETLAREHLRAKSAASARGTRDFTKVWETRAQLLGAQAGTIGVELSDPGPAQAAQGPGESACPLCGARYRDGIERCADCLVPLVKQVPLPGDAPRISE